MPLDYVPVVVVRTENAHLGGGDYDETEGQLPGSPFLARVYRATQKVFDRDEAPSGNASVDRMPRLSVMDPACPIREGDVALIPQPGGGTRRAVVLLVRPYGDRIQCDLEMGGEGDATGIPGPLLNPPAPSAQAQIDAQAGQIDALSQKIKDLEMAASLPQPAQPDPIVVLTASATLTRPTQSTVREIKPTANMVTTLYPATGSGIVEKFDVSALGGFTFAVALASGDSYDASNAGVAAAIAQLIANGAASFSLRDVAPNTWHWE